MKENNGLIKSESSIIRKVINFFKNVFWKNKLNENTNTEATVNKETEITSNKTENIIDSSLSKLIYSNELLSQEELELKSKSEEELLEESDTEYEEADEELIIEYLSDKTVSSNFSEVDIESEKRRILELYKNVKAGIISVDNVDELDLIIINPLLEEEIKIETKIIQNKF